MKKKILAASFLALILTTLLIGCGKKVECDFCGETKKGETRKLFGEPVAICNDCIKDMQDWYK